MQIDFVQNGDRWKPVNPDGTDHWLTCLSSAARQRRIRAAKEPGYFPVSYSSVRSYERCPMYWHTFNDPRNPDRLEEPTNGAALLGRAFHGYAAAAILGRPLPERPNVPLELWKDWRIMKVQLDRQLREGQWTKEGASTEDEMLYEWRDGEAIVQFKSFLDYWIYDTQRTVISDFKTGWEVSSNLAEDPQGLGYALNAKRNAPKIQQVQFQQVQFRFGGQIEAAIYTDRDVDRFEEALRATVGRMLRDTEFKPNPWCSVCPPGLHPVSPLPSMVPRSRAEAEAQAAGTHLLELSLKELKEGLRDWTAVNGPVLGYGHHPREQTKVANLDGAIQVLQSLGMNADEFLSFDGTKLRSLLKRKKTAHVAAELEPFLATKTVTQFGWKADPSEPAAEPTPTPPDPVLMTSPSMDPVVLRLVSGEEG